MRLQVPLLGSEKSAITKIELGYDPQLEEEFQALELRIAQEKANEDNLQKLCKHLQAIHDPKDMLVRAMAAWRQSTQAWGKSLVERAELMHKREAMRGATVEIGVQTGGSVDLTIGSKRAVLRKQFNRGSFGIDRDGAVAFTTADGKSAPL